MKLVDPPGKAKGKSSAKTEITASPGQSLPQTGRQEIIKKCPINPNLVNYEKSYQTFDWDQARGELDWFASGKINAAYNAVDRHMSDGRRNKVALYAIDAKNKLSKLTFQDVYEQSNKLGNALKKLGVEKGDRVFVFLPRVPELYVTTVAIAKIGAIAGPLFSAFGPDALRDRLQDSEATVIITNPELKPKLDSIRKELPDLA
ncbi:MAG: AMP-binding protein [Candidatus Obscuribacterales bacterium]